MPLPPAATPPEHAGGPISGDVFFGGALVAAVVAGMVALFAPCCISVMLPAFFATSFQNRRVLVAMTLVFAAGIATVIVPIALGMSALRSILFSNHTLIYAVGGIGLIGFGAYMLTGGQIHLPMPGRRSNGTGPVSVYLLGVFSGITSTCCAPVLAGVMALSGLTSSVFAAGALGLTYVFGMVLPLFLISLLWEKRDWRQSRLFRPRTFTWYLGPVRRTVSGSGLAAGALLVVMGIWTLYGGIFGNPMPNSAGWQGRVSLWLQSLGRTVTTALSSAPGWLAAAVIAVAIALLVRRALRETGINRRTAPSPAIDAVDTTEPTEREVSR